jgi:hypothetical protein
MGLYVCRLCIYWVNPFGISFSLYTADGRGASSHTSWYVAHDIAEDADTVCSPAYPMYRDTAWHHIRSGLYACIFWRSVYAI